MEAQAFTGELARQAVQIAIKGAQDYLRTHKLNADPEALRHCVRVRCQIALQPALDDAKEAFAAGMTQVAASTFSASMFLAGITAAKEAADPLTSIMIRAQLEANKSQSAMVVVDDGMAVPKEQRFQFCPSVAKGILFPLDCQVVLVTIKPESR